MLNIVCALNCEARPLIGALRLQNQNLQGPFPVYAGNEVRLIISGMGRLAAGAACTFLAGRYPDPLVPAWLNCGIGGTRSLAIGEARWAHRITDTVSDQVYYPGLGLQLAMPSSEVLTADQAVNDYPNDVAIYDMEAAGFYAMASAFSPSELIHCIKIISDNTEQSHQLIDKAMVESLVAQQLPAILQSIEQLIRLQQDYQQQRGNADYYFELMHKFRFSQSQKTQLKRLLFRWQALRGEPDATTIAPQQFRSSKELIRYLEEQLSEHSMRIDQPR